jgi:hypothetical protein
MLRYGTGIKKEVWLDGSQFRLDFDLDPTFAKTGSENCQIQIQCFKKIKDSDPSQEHWLRLWFRTDQDITKNLHLRIQLSNTGYGSESATLV